MSQHDFVIDNQSFPATRADLNLAILAAVSNSSGADAPTTTYANQFWYETDTNTLYIRNEANDAWVVALKLDTALTSTNTELNKLTGATVSAAELNKLTGATASTAELNKLTGATLSTAELNKLAGATVTTTELNQLATITRGSLLYGDASGATARLAKGSAATVLTSDGTDIAWAASTSGAGSTKAFVNFNAGSIRDSGNVSSVSDYGTGDFGTNFTTNMADANFTTTFGSSPITNHPVTSACTYSAGTSQIRGRWGNTGGTNSVGQLSDVAATRGQVVVTQ
tara:strand:+ start:314 stop:1162 length:849 start_codon:yes stop_codon:yes gene_type:complete